MTNGRHAASGNKGGALPVFPHAAFFLAAVLLVAGHAAATDAVSHIVRSDGKGNTLRVDISRNEGRSTAVPTAVVDPARVEAYRSRIPAPSCDDFRAADTDGAAAPRTGFLSDDRAGNDPKHDGSSYVSAAGAVALAGEIRDRLRSSRGMSARGRANVVVDLLKTTLSREGIR